MAGDGAQFQTAEYRKGATVSNAAETSKAAGRRDSSNVVFYRSGKSSLCTNYYLQTAGGAKRYPGERSISRQRERRRGGGGGWKGEEKTTAGSCVELDAGEEGGAAADERLSSHPKPRRIQVAVFLFFFYYT